jgi:hypothetical protein
MRQANLIPASSDAHDPAAAGDPYAKFRFVGTAFAIVIVAASVMEFISNARHPIARDFISFWGAARLVLAGHPAAAYDNAALHSVQSAAASFGAGAQMPFPYAPAYLALVTPFGLLPFPIALVVWTACTFTLYLFAARKLMPGSGWLAAAFPAVYANAAVGQNGFLTAGIFMGGLSLLSRRPFAAGLVLGCMVIKPQLGLLLPVALLAARAWRAIAGAAISSIGILAAGAALFGLSTMAAWIHQMPLYAAITRDGLVGWSKLASIYAAMREFGLGPGAALTVNGIAALAAALAVWQIWRSNPEDGAKVAILSAAAALASPYLLFYDTLILVPAFLFLARQNERPAVIFALWCLPLLQIAQIGTFDTRINLNALMGIALTAMIYVRWRAQNSDAQPGSRDPILRIEQPSRVTLS